LSPGGRGAAAAGDTGMEGAGVMTLIDDQPRLAIAYIDQCGQPRCILVIWRSCGRATAPAWRSGRITAVGASIVEMPVRFRPVPTIQLCRMVYIAIDQDEPPPLPARLSTSPLAVSPSQQS